MTDELKPCPFCCGEAELCEGMGEFWVLCTNENCKASGGLKNTHDEAISRWNTRTATDEQFAYAVHDGEAWRKVKTCKLIMRDGSPACSECLAEQDYNAKFCDQCGAEVIDDD